MTDKMIVCEICCRKGYKIKSSLGDTCDCREDEERDETHHSTTFSLQNGLPNDFRLFLSHQGKGDSIVLKINKSVLLIYDAGYIKYSENLKKAILDSLSSDPTDPGENFFFLVVISHNDEDHRSGLEKLVGETIPCICKDKGLNSKTFLVMEHDHYAVLPLNLLKYIIESIDFVLRRSKEKLLNEMLSELKKKLDVYSFIGVPIEPLKEAINLNKNILQSLDQKDNSLMIKKLEEINQILGGELERYSKVFKNVVLLAKKEYIMNIIFEVNQLRIICYTSPLAKEHTNDKSIVVIVESQNDLYCLTGDQSISTIHSFLQNHKDKTLQLFQVPHHGSKNNYLTSYGLPFSVRYLVTGYPSNKEDISESQNKTFTEMGKANPKAKYFFAQKYLIYLFTCSLGFKP